jgi:hypothetical protein
LLLGFGAVEAGHDVVMRKCQIVERLRAERIKAVDQLHQKRRIRPVHTQSPVAKWLGIA